MNKNNKFEVLFCISEEESYDTDPFQVLIWPSNFDLNDFRHKTHCNYKVLDGSGNELKGEILIALLNHESESQKGGEGLGNFITDRQLQPRERITRTELGVFFALLPSMQEYRNQVRFWGVDVCTQFLSAVNDLVYFQSLPDKHADSEVLSAAINTSAFKLSFMRNSEPFYAYHNAESILNGLDFEDTSRISSSLNLEFKLDGFANSHNINFRFSNDGILPKRINVLIGENGIGKSRTLNQIVKAALQQRGYKDSLVDPESKDKRPMISRLLAIGTPGETGNTYPSGNIKNPKLDYRRLVLTRNGSKGVGRNLLQLARTDESISSLERWDIFLQAISKCLDIDKLYIAKKKKFKPSRDRYTVEKEYLPVKKLQNGWEEQILLEQWSEIDSAAEPKLKIGEQYYALSSGQLAFFKFALLACLNIENGSLVLIDEPETHLHPNLIAEFVELLDRILASTGSYAIVATHSSFFIREVTGEQVFVFKVSSKSLTSDNRIDIVNPRLETYGANIGSISHFVFGDVIEPRLAEKLIRKAKEKGYNLSELTNECFERVSVRILAQIEREWGAS